MNVRLAAGCSVSLVLFTVLLPGAEPSAAETWIDLLSQPDSWTSSTKGWMQADSVTLDVKDPRRLAAVPGKGILVNSPRGSAPDLVTRRKFGDHQIRLEFLIGKKSNSGVKFHGLYEIQIYDSHGKEKLTGSDCGGVYPRAELLPRYRHIDEGIAPRVNAARPAGEWQLMEAVFLAPRFHDGRKSANARLTRAVLNGQLIHENVELKTPTGHNWHNAESATGPLLLQGDHGPVAFRNVRVRPLAEK
jgi:hypothetical protein